MNKIIKCLIILLVASVIGVRYINAMSENDLKYVLTKPYLINGVTYQATASEIVHIDKYLAQNEVSEEDADYIANKVNEVIDIINKSGVKVKSISEFPQDVKDSLISLTNDITSNTGVKLNINNESLVVYNIDGTVFGEYSSILIKQIDNNATIVWSIILIVIVIGSFMVVRHIKSKTVTYA